jgi:hypothetical protein
LAKWFLIGQSQTRSAIDASYQVSVHLAQPFQRRLLEIDQPETRIAYGGHVC